MKYSQTFIGRQIFASMWGISLFAALGNAKLIKLPFDAKFKSYMAMRQNKLEVLVNDITELTGLSKEVMDIALKEAPWLRIKGDYYDTLGLNGEFAMSLGKKEWIEYDYTNFEDILRVSSTAIRIELLKFFNALLEARFCFYSGKEGNLPVQCQVIFQNIVDFIGEIRPYSKIENLFAGVYHEWLQKDASLILVKGEYEPNYKTWLSTRILEFKIYFQQ